MVRVPLTGNPTRATRGMVGAALAILALGLPSEARGQGEARPEVVSIGFVGNQSIEDEVLEGAIVTRATRCRFSWLVPLCWLGFGHDRSYLGPREFANDHSRLGELYRQLGYRGVQVDTFVVRNPDATAEITFTIREGEPHRVTSLTITGLESVGDSTVTENLPLSVGDPLNLTVLEAARDSIGQRLRNRGYAYADVLRGLFLPSGTRDAEVEFDVYTGPLARIGEIEIVRGEEGGELSDAVILRMLPFQEGSVYRMESLFDAQRSLYGLEIVRHAAIVEDLSRPDGIVPLRLEVSEGDSHRVRTEGGWNSAECFRAESQWSSFNFMGGARRLSVRGNVSNLFTRPLEGSICSGAGKGVYGEPNWIVSLDFSQPFLVTPRHSLAASLFVERQSLQDVFVREAGGLDLRLNRTFGRVTSLTLSWRPQLSRLDAAEVFFCTSFLVCNPQDIDLLQAANWLSPIGASFFHDRRNRLISPTGGYTFLTDLEFAGSWSGSDFVYDRGIVEMTGFLGMPLNSVLAARVRTGWLRAGEFEGLTALPADADRRVPHPQKRFYAGGANSVRGYAQNELGQRVASVAVEDLLFGSGGSVPGLCAPEAIADLSCDATGVVPRFQSPTGGSRMVEGSAELRFPIWEETVSGAAFVDFGQVWDGGGRFDFDRLVATPGLGVRYATPIGPVRLDVAYRDPDTSGRSIVTSQVRPFQPGVDSDADRIGPTGTDCDANPGNCLDWVRLPDLAPLGPLVSFEDGSEKFLNRLQFHLSIGQAF